MKKLLIVLITLYASLFAFKIEQEFNIKTIKVSTQSIANYKEYYAKVAADTSKVYDVTLRFDAFVTDLYANEEYRYINKGDSLATVYSEDIYNLFNELKIAKERSQNIYEMTREKIKLFDIDPNTQNSKKIVLKSKYNGYLSLKKIKEGSFVKKGQTLFEITDLSSVWVYINIYQRDREFVKKNMDVSLSFDGLSKTYHAKIAAIYPYINPKDQTFLAKVILENQDLALIPNLYAKAKVYEDTQKSLFIPHNAVIQRDQKHYVFIKEGTYYTPREIQAQRLNQGYKVLQGLGEGDEIVANALFLLDSDALTNGLYSDDW